MKIAYKDLKSCESVRNLLRKINRAARLQAAPAPRKGVR